MKARNKGKTNWAYSKTLPIAFNSTSVYVLCPFETLCFGWVWLFRVRSTKKKEEENHGNCSALWQERMGSGSMCWSLLTPRPFDHRAAGGRFSLLKFGVWYFTWSCLLNIHYIWCLVDIREWSACIVQKLAQSCNIYIFNAADYFHWSLPYFSDIKCIFTMITLSFIILSYYIQIMGKKNGHFSFLCFYFYKCIAYISHLYQMFCSLFSYAFSTFRTQNRKRERAGI